MTKVDWGKNILFAQVWKEASDDCDRSFNRRLNYLKENCYFRENQRATCELPAMSRKESALIIRLEYSCPQCNGGDGWVNKIKSGGSNH